MTKQQDEQAPDKRLAEIRERRERVGKKIAKQGFVHPLEFPRWEDIDYLLSLLQQQPAGERCGEPEVNLALVADGMSYCGPLRMFKGHETTYISGFDLARAIKVLSEFLKPNAATTAGEGQPLAELDERINANVARMEESQKVSQREGSVLI